MARASGEVSAPVAGRPSRGRLVWAVAGYVACGLVIAALITLGTVFHQRAEAGQERAADRDAALRSARQVATNLTNVGKETVKEDVDRLLRGTTGEFRKQFGEQASSFGETVAKEQVSSEGTVTEAALNRMDGDTAVAMTAVSATVRNAAAPEGQQRQYRFRVTLQRSDGVWLVSKLEFVP